MLLSTLIILLFWKAYVLDNLEQALANGTAVGSSNSVNGAEAQYLVGEIQLQTKEAERISQQFDWS